VGNSCFQVISPEYGLIELELSFPTPNVSASICLLSKLEIQARENLERWQASSIVIDSKLWLDKNIHNGIASFEHVPKTDTQRYQSAAGRPGQARPGWRSGATLDLR
jgi:hypothetical protein